MIQTQSNLALSYAQAGYLVSNQQFGTWNGTATSAGLVTQYGKTPNTARAVNIYRTDWQGRQLLYPTPRTNYRKYSNNFLDSSYSVTNSAVTANAVLGPDSVNNASAWIPVASAPTGAYQTLLQVYTSISNKVVWFLKADGITKYDVTFGNGDYSKLDLSAGTFVVAQNFSGSIEALSGGWYRLNYETAYVGPTGAALCLNSLSEATTGSNGCYVFEFGEYDTEGVLIPTSGSPVTLTDYTLTGTTVNLAQAPASTATTNATFYAT